MMALMDFTFKIWNLLCELTVCEPFVIMSQYTPRENVPIWYPVLI